MGWDWSLVVILRESELEFTVMVEVTIQEFLDRKGGVGLLVVLNERGKSYSEIEAEVAISSSTISKRKDEALELGLIEMNPSQRYNRTVTEYHLTPLGENLVRQMSLMGIVSNYQDMRTHQKKVEEKTEELIEWIGENPDQIGGYTEAQEETLIDRNETPSSEDSSDTDRQPDTENTGSDMESDHSEDETSTTVVRPPDESDSETEERGQPDLHEMSDRLRGSSVDAEQEQTDQEAEDSDED